MKRVNVAVAVAEEAFGSLQTVADACCSLGFEHDLTLASVGVLTGSAEIGGLAKLRAIPGVVAVVIEHAIPSAARYGND